MREIVDFRFHKRNYKTTAEISREGIGDPSRT